jgi:transposase-like protein
VQLLESTGSIRLAAEQIGVSSRTLSRWLTHYGIRAVVRYEYEAAEAA